MERGKRKKLEKSGYEVGSVNEFLELSEAEVAYLDIRIQLGSLVREYRKKHHLTQTELAVELGTSQSRLAKMESGDPSTSIDLLVKSLLKLGITKKALGHAFS
jgi:DNA-binding XRE family transcriptional regulator